MAAANDYSESLKKKRKADILYTEWTARTEVIYIKSKQSA